jgi:hypothetical protein
MPNPVGALTKIKKMFSPLEKAVVAHKLESMPSAQWQAYIKANAPKAAKKEALAVKLDELLARQPKVTKAEIVQHIKDNSPKIKTKLLKNDPYFAGDVDNHMNIEPDGMGGYNYLDADGQVEYNARNAHDMAGYLNSTEGAKYGEHTLPGGQNYQEMLLSLPRNQSQAIIRNQKVYEIKDANGQLLATGQLPMSPRTLQKVNNNPDWVVREFEQPNPNDLRRDPANFQSGHYDDPNILAHIRMNDRPTAEGKRALFLEELQSDWAQKGRKEGFLTPDLHVERRAEIKAEMDALANEATAMRERGESPVDIHQRMRQLDDALRDIPTPKGVPRAPYVEDTGDWTGLSLKKAIERAVEQGHDSIAWTTGAQQADRYNLAKQIDSIHHNVNPDGTYSFSAIKNGQEVISKENLTPDELADHLGKDVAGKIVKGEGGSSPSGTSVGWQPESSIYGEIDDVAPEYKTLSGLDLEVGGEGMKGYYDQIVPQTANDILKSMGVTERVKPIGVQLGNNVSEQMGFQITPEIRDYVLNQGLPAFAEGGAVHMDEGGLWEGYGAPLERNTQKRQSAYYPQQEQSVRVTPSGVYRKSADGDVDISEYTMGADIDILNKYGFGVTKQGQVVKLPERSYTFDDGYTETQPARKIKHSDISELRARYTTDDGVQYGVVRQPLAKGWSGYRSDPRSQSSIGVNVSPYYKGINYTKNFAEGGAVDADSVDYDELYEFKKDQPAFAHGGEVDYDAMYEFR